MTTLFHAFSTGSVTCGASCLDAAAAEWHPHPAFPGVALKHLVTGDETDGRFSVHLVRLDADAEIGDHVHDGRWELHEVADGEGFCVLEGKTIPYRPGVLAVLPENTLHKVRAGSAGLALLAKFIPALA